MEEDIKITLRRITVNFDHVNYLLALVICFDRFPGVGQHLLEFPIKGGYSDRCRGYQISVVTKTLAKYTKLMPI